MRCTFPIYKEVQNEDGSLSLLLDKDISTSALTAEKDGSAFATTFYNNGDGTYYFEYNASGAYSVKINGSYQDELRNIHMTADDVLLSWNLAAAPTRGQLKNNAGTLEIENAATMLLESDIVDSTSSTSTTDPLSANQGYVLNNKIDDDIQQLRNDMDDEDEALLERIMDIEADINLNFASPNFLNEAKSISQNLEILDTAIAAVSGVAGVIDSEMLYNMLDFADSGADDAVPAAERQWEVNSTTYVDVLRLPFYRNADAQKIILRYEEYILYAGTTVTGRLNVLIDGVSAGVDGYVNQESGPVKLDFEINSIEIDITGYSEAYHILTVQIRKESSGANYEIRRFQTIKQSW
jgi:hypothetical protein